MIALKTMKYLIWDYCLTKLFEGFYKNLVVHATQESISVNDLTAGMKISKIIHHGVEYEGCTIHGVGRRHFNQGYYIAFVYEKLMNKGSGYAYIFKNDNEPDSTVEFIS